MHISRNEKRYFWLLQLVQLLFIAMVYKMILMFNHGHFVYTMDDPYIFFAMSQHHFMGVSSGIVTNASSSLLGLYVLTLFQPIFGVYFPLILNIFSALITTFIYWKIVTVNAIEAEKTELGRMAVILLLIVASFQIPLIFTGMEHNIQFLLTALGFYGIVYEGKHHRTPWWIYATMIVLPLWRYDCLVVFASMFIYFYFRGYAKQVIGSLFAVVLLLALYFAWWHLHGQPYFPASLIAKSKAIFALNHFFETHQIDSFLFIGGSLLVTFLFSAMIFFCRQWIIPRARMIGTLLILLFCMYVINSDRAYYYLLGQIYYSFGSIFLILYFLTSKEFAAKQLMVLAIVTQIILIRIFSIDFSHYRFLCFAFISVICALYCLMSASDFYIETSKKPWRILVVLIAIFALCFPKNLNNVDITQDVVASHSIYRQQYQMARFVRDYYKGNVGVNDLGLVAYFNPFRTIDLCGLGDSQIFNNPDFKANQFCGTSMILDSLLKENDIRLLMVYVGKAAFTKIPDRFILIAKLVTLPPTTSIGLNEVSFYVTQDEYVRTRQLLEAFKETLPKGDVLLIRNSEESYLAPVSK